MPSARASTGCSQPKRRAPNPRPRQADGKESNLCVEVLVAASSRSSANHWSLLRTKGSDSRGTPFVK